MKKLISVLLFLVYLLTSIVYIDLYEFKNVRNIMWDNNKVSGFMFDDIKKDMSCNELINNLEVIAKRNDVNICSAFYIDRSANNKSKINIYTTFNGDVFKDIRLNSGRLLNNNDDSKCFMSSEKLNDHNQIGQINFFNLNTEINIYKISEIFNHWDFSLVWFVDNKDLTKLSSLKKDIKDTLQCDVHFYSKDPDNSSGQELDYYNVNPFIKLEDAEISMTAYYLQHRIIGILIILYIITFLAVIYWISFRCKELAVKKMLGKTNIKLKFEIIFKDLLKYHIYELCLSGIIILSFLIYKIGVNNTISFFKDWLLFNIGLTLTSLLLMFIPLNLIKYIKIPLMLKNKKPTKVTQRINYVAKCLIGIATVTVIINSNSALHSLMKKVEENKIWDTGLNYCCLRHMGFFDDGANGFSKDKIKNFKQYFKLSNSNGAIYIDAYNYKHNIIKKTEEMYMLSHNEKLPIYSDARSLSVNNNYLQINPIYDAAGKQVNIPDHDDHTLNLLVPQSLKQYEEKIKEEYTSEYYNNGWPDYKLNIIYIKDNQKCFSFDIDAKTYVIGSIIQVISNNNLSSDIYRAMPCNGFYPKITNIDNPYQDALPDIKTCNIESDLVGATTLYETAAQEIYNTKQSFLYTIELMIFSVVALIMLIISTCINYLEQNKISNMIKKLHGIGFMSRSANLMKSSTLIWLISICLMIILNYKEEMVSKILSWLFIPSDVILIHKLVPGGYFYLNLIDWKIVLLVILSDLIISTIFLKIYENKKISSVLKGE